jgi:hypothetical protein
VETRRAPPNQVRFGVPNLIRATDDSRPSPHAICANPIRAFRSLNAHANAHFESSSRHRFDPQYALIAQGALASLA